MNEKECKYGGGSPNSYEAPLVEIEEVTFEEPLIDFKSRLIEGKVVVDKNPNNCGFFVELDKYVEDKSNSEFNENIYRGVCGFYGAKLFYEKHHNSKNGTFFKVELNTNSKEVKEAIENIERSSGENKKSAYLRQVCLYR